MILKKVALSLAAATLIVLMISSVFACEPPERGKITGGGHGDIGSCGIPGGSFGFNVMWFSKDPAPKGELEYVDHTTGMNVHAHEMWTLEVWEVLEGNKPWPRKRATFSGPCTVNGDDGYVFTVYAEDNGEPGKNDIFHIVIDDAAGTYYVGGSLSDPILCGNIQIHKPPK
ncbi:MAG: post-COAP-1 domain-containing protein [Candidatus Ranarchaeia archaeon]